MEPTTMVALGKAGAVAVLGLTGAGSAVGVAAAGIPAIGAWKKAYANGQKALFTLLVFVGNPLSQIIYSMILMLQLRDKVVANPENWALYLGAGIFAGIGMGVSAWFQGKVCGASCDALAETGKGFTNYLMVVGIAETVALFIMVFTLMVI
jgi:V/A-type H+-transporting ATPase subunit K